MFRKIWISACLLFSVVVSVVAQEPADTVEAAPVAALETEAQSGGEALVNKAVADKAYADGNYAEAARLYEQLLDNQGEAAAVYYNLGNAYYKQNELAKAILNYERALLLNPGDDDIRFNLELAKSKTVDKITPLSEVFFVVWARDFASLMSTDGWAQLSCAAWVLFLLGLALYRFARKMSVRKVSFFSAILCLVLAVITVCASSYQKNIREQRNKAIVMLPSVTVKSTPDNSGTDLFVLHEGHKVEIKDDSMREWKEIRLEDGNVGWISAKAIEVI